MNNTNRFARLPHLLKRQLAAAPLLLVDIGCSGGIDTAWQCFGPLLRAIGFDPLLAEVDRLRAQETRPGFVYEAAFVGCDRFEDLFPPSLRNDPIASGDNSSFARTSAQRALDGMAMNYTKEVFNQGDEVRFADRHVELDAYLAERGIATVDFIKIDTDGHDIEALLGAARTLRTRGVLGVQVECQFHGPVHPYANTFANIDRLMREAGFTLFDLDAWHYTRRDMPGVFALDKIGQTRTGAVQWADAVYFRDLGDPDHGKKTGFAAEAIHLHKLACLFEFFGLNDCVAELIVRYPGAFAGGSEQLLDLMTPLSSGKPGVYRQYLEMFDADPTRFLTPVEQQRRKAP